MPGFVIHAFAPPLAFLAIRRFFDPRIVVYCWPFTLLPDVDYFLGVHRATTMNVFFLAGVLLVTHGLARAFDRARARIWTVTAGAYLASHILMDVFTGGVVLFYPVSVTNYCWFWYIEAVTATNDVTVYWEPCISEGPPVVSTVYPVLDTDQAAMIAFLAVAWVGYVAARVVSTRKTRSRGEPEP